MILGTSHSHRLAAKRSEDSPKVAVEFISHAAVAQTRVPFFGREHRVQEDLRELLRHLAESAASFVPTQPLQGFSIGNYRPKVGAPASRPTLG